tara:strand:+ start:175 stop:387 length:213 start_codon:yes stop_codon:yes gene_type:complete
MRNDEKIIKCMREIRENISSGMFMIDEEVMDEMIECGAREFEVDELEVALDNAIKWMEWDFKLRSEKNND